MQELLLIGFATASLGGCVVSSVATTPNELSDTRWTLIDVRETAKAEPTEVLLNKYSMTLARDGSASFVLDCNRGTGNWSSLGTSADKGRLTFGPIAATRALCSDDGLGERLARDLSGSVDYKLYDGRLTLTTPAATYTFDSIA